MGNKLTIPKPQHRYLEPYKNRVFQYDTKHSNLFLSQYTNQILQAVGNDVIVRGVDVTPFIDDYKTGLEFEVAPGSFVQDLTFFELPTKSTISLSDIVNFENYYVIIYTNWRYLNTIYENNLKIEATLYNPITRKSITGWNSATNRIILGIFKYKIENGKIVGVEEVKENIFFEDSNIIKNGLFDTKTYKFWTAINSTLKVYNSNGVEDTPYLEITPTADNYQGIGQVIDTKLNYNYHVSLYTKSDNLVPFRILILDGSNLYNFSAPEVVSINGIAQKTWTNYTFTFTAISNKTTFFFLKSSESLNDIIDVDNIFCLEYTKTRKQTDINKIKIIDGGDISASIQ